MREEEMMGARGRQREREEERERERGMCANPPM